MNYIELIIEVSNGDVEALTDLLAENEVTAVEVMDNTIVDDILEKKEEYKWDYIDEGLLALDREALPMVKVYFDGDASGRAKADQIKEVLQKAGNCGNEAYKIEEKVLDDQDWMNSYKEHFKALYLTEDLLVRPSWETGDSAPGVKVMELDPGMAFGTGTHETTAMCAKLMAKAGCQGKTVLDVGTGSGILAIAAALLGSSTVLGVDIDPLAVEIAKENVEINHCQDKVEIAFGDLTKGIEFEGDIVVANLMAELVVMLTAHVKQHMKKGGIYISSGILTEKKPMVLEAIQEAGLTVVEVMDEWEWSA
ncbi:MAG: 50S ribosomal protein L11 methyltransferase, partial [Anaerovoracaceae bacterium]